MLVLTRKIGQQIVLPEHGITIDVVEASKTHVRLAISAPANVQVHRREVWDRVLGPGDGSPSVGCKPAFDRETDGRENGAIPPPPEANLDQCLAWWIAKRTGGRIRRLAVETRGNRIIIRGSARSFYARQLVQAAVQEVLETRGEVPPRLVEYKMEIGGEEKRRTFDIGAKRGQNAD